MTAGMGDKNGDRNPDTPHATDRHTLPNTDTDGIGRILHLQDSYALTLRPGDKLVLVTRRRVSTREVDAIRSRLDGRLTGVQIIVIDDVDWAFVYPGKETRDRLLGVEPKTEQEKP